MSDHGVCIIAEAGINHNGSFETAVKMIDVAKQAGADVVKFQTANLDALVSKYADMAAYQKKNMQTTKSQKDMLRDLLLPFEDFRKLSNYCEEIGIQFLSTPFDIDSIRFLDAIQRIWKIPSGEITNYPYLVEIAKTGKEIILSTGMSTMEEVEEALDILAANGGGKTTLLHCTTDYPASYTDVNLKAMLAMKEQFGCEVGYSDHTKGIEIPVAAVALGATVIEKHFTLDRTMEGPDHKASLEPDEFASMVRAVRNVERALGDGVKKPVESEMGNLPVARKSIVASKRIRAGELLTEENLTTKRPGNGISPMQWNNLLGTRAIKDFEEDELITI